ncbi:MAG: hypothetical protein H0W13_01525 [Nitrospirales bacterium]|nr:hypothetical protein [Nitrospirales bacterium]
MIETLAEWLSHDVALWGGLYSPLLSWIGAGALIIFSLWQAMRLYADVRAARALCTDIDDSLAPLLKERRVTHRDPLASHHHTFRPKPLEHNNSRDSDDLGILDRLMDLDPAMSQAWAQYRKTLVLEEVAWFQEPRIFSTRHAEEFFTFDRLFARRIHYAGYSHVPSFVTGISLLLTFVALLMGLSHLHADDQGIQGLQGLINGLAGKFLTSIVGLLCANIFSLVEKRVSVRLVTAHQELVDSLEGLFPRKMLEQWLEEQNGSPGSMKDKERSAGRPDLEGSLHNLGLMIQDLTMAVKTQTLALDVGSDSGDSALKVGTPVSHVQHGRFAAIPDISGR